ncbi:hypothetical protein ACFPMF_03335 [Larkinella bovis]|uniref:Uncharacterized protein n=1 Tax=Larkinella bovis TaxID=683041 RepID=A0ABW0I480_9BACT
MSQKFPFHLKPYETSLLEWYSASQQDPEFGRLEGIQSYIQERCLELAA